MKRRETNFSFYIKKRKNMHPKSFIKVYPKFNYYETSLNRQNFQFFQKTKPTNCGRIIIINVRKSRALT